MMKLHELLIASTLASWAASAAAPVPDSFGAPRDNIASRLQPDGVTYEEGEHIFIYMDVFNAGGQEEQVNVGAGLAQGLELNGPGDQIIKRRPRRAGRFRPMKVPAGKQVEAQYFYVSGNQLALYPPLKAGSYVLRWNGKAGDGLIPPAASSRFKVKAKAPSRMVPDSELKDVPFGKEAGGLQTRVWSRWRKFYAGEPVMLTVELKNVSDRSHDYHFPQVFINGRLDVRSSNGTKIPYISHSAQTMNNRRTVKPGATALLESADLAMSYFVFEPGKYTVRFPGAKAWGAQLSFPGTADKGPPDSSIPPSNEFGFEVLPAKVRRPVQEVLGRLLQMRPEGWNCETSPISNTYARPGPRWSRVRTVSYLFTHREMYRGGRLDQLQIAPVSFTITSSKPVKEPWHFDARRQRHMKQADYLGESPFGHVFLVPPEPSALKHWPSPKKDLTKCLEIE
ncbi:MAG: hypothetical protein QF473_31855 [Planctomycetota bacterium]|nr:hypothetical protein [Planctomycetota bacterium]